MEFFMRCKGSGKIRSVQFFYTSGFGSISFSSYLSRQLISSDENVSLKNFAGNFSNLSDTNCACKDGL